jgi:DNA-binding GntR family transcriptional regulator
MNLPQTVRLREIIERDIVSRKLKPGERLSEPKLAKIYGTSRSPVREALRLLSSDGLIHITPNKGAVVAQFDVRELIEQFEVLAELEGACGRLAAKSRMDQDFDAIGEAQETCRKYAEQRDVKGFFDADGVFHEAVCAASKNNFLVKLTLGVGKRLAPYRRSMFEQMELKSEVLEHDEIVHAIKESLAEDAVRLLQRHVVNLGGGDFRRLVVLLASET